jgi:hypothetical protein
MNLDRYRRGPGAILRKRFSRRGYGLVIPGTQLPVEVLEHARRVLQEARAAHRIPQIVDLASQGRLVARQIVDQLIDLDHHHGRQGQRDGQGSGDGAHHCQPPRQPPALKKPDQRRKQNAQQNGERDGYENVAGEIEGGDDNRQNDEIRKAEACRNDQVRSPANWPDRIDPVGSLLIGSGGECSKARQGSGDRATANPISRSGCLRKHREGRVN